MTHGALRELGPFRLMHGCEAGDETCFGPIGSYWTLFDSPLELLTGHAGVAVALGALLAAIAWRRRRAVGLAAGLGIATAVAGFLALAWAFPVRVDY